MNRPEIYKVCPVILTVIITTLTAQTVDLSPISGIDYSRLTGQWHEIARLPNRRQRGMTDVTHTFTLTGNDGITLVSQGRREKRGKPISMKSTARLPKSHEPARLKMKFYGLISFEYDIIDIDKENYRYVVVSADDGKYLWVLSRTPRICDQRFRQLTAGLVSRGIDLASLERTLHVDAVVNR